MILLLQVLSAFLQYQALCSTCTEEVWHLEASRADASLSVVLLALSQFDCPGLEGARPYNREIGIVMKAQGLAGHF